MSDGAAGDPFLCGLHKEVKGGLNYVSWNS